MDGLQVDTSSREKVPPSQDSHKFVATQSHPVDTYTASPFSPDLNEHSASPLYEGKPEASERRRSFIPCGLSVLLYTILIAALTAIIVGGAVGGGVGGALSNKSTSSSTVTKTVTSAAATATVTATGTSSSTATATSLARNYTPLLPAQVNTTALDCNDQSTVTSTQGDQFQLNCNINYAGNDIVAFIAYTLDTCIDACSALNVQANTTECHGVLFNSNMATVVSEGNSGNCWLKSLMANPTMDGLPPSVGAVLVTS